MDQVYPKGSRSYLKNQPIPRLDEEAIDVVVELASAVTWSGTGISVYCLEGAFGRVAEAATAFPNRSAKYWLEIFGFWSDPAEDERLTEFARASHARMQPFAAPGQYVNFLGAEPLAGAAAATEAARRAYGPEKHERLVALKNRYDPENLFRLNHNIIPTPASPAP
jgi:hypothetical protein